VYLHKEDWLFAPSDVIDMDELVHFKVSGIGHQALFALFAHFVVKKLYFHCLSHPAVINWEHIVYCASGLS